MFWGGRAGVAALLCSLIPSPGSTTPDDPRAIVERSVTAHGGKEAFYRLRDLLFTETTRSKDGTRVVERRLLFDGERSCEKNAVRGECNCAKGAEGSARLHAVYFWAVFPFKLLDSGARFTASRPRTLNGTRYSVVDVSYAPGTGFSNDRYRLFIDPSSRLIDRVIYSKSEPEPAGTFAMTCRYEDVSGIQICVDRTISRTNGFDDPIGQKIESSTLNRIRFWNGFEKKDFEFPGATCNLAR